MNKAHDLFGHFWFFGLRLIQLTQILKFVITNVKFAIENHDEDDDEQQQPYRLLMLVDDDDADDVDLKMVVVAVVVDQ